MTHDEAIARSFEQDCLTVAYVGSIAMPDERAHNPAFSPAGAKFQEGLIRSLAAAGADIEYAFLVPPIPSWPNSRRLVTRRRRTTILGTIPTTLLPMINLGALKPVTAGLALLLSLILWSIRNRHHRRRVIVTYNVANPSGFATVIAARLTGIVAVAIVADVPVPAVCWSVGAILRKLEYWVQTRSLRSFDGLVVLTQSISDDFAPLVPCLIMEGAVAGGVLRQTGTAQRAVSTQFAHETFVVMYSGALTNLKGIRLLLEAFQQLRERKFELWITGDGPLRSEVEAVAKHDNRIQFWGLVTTERLSELYARASVLVNPHLVNEPSARYVFPSKLLDYLATGRPVISTISTPAVATEFGRVIFAVDEPTATALALKIREVAALPRAARESRGEAGRGVVLSSKTWKVQGRRIVKFIDSLTEALHAAK